jgi:hypothetical protein
MFETIELTTVRCEPVITQYVGDLLRDERPFLEAFWTLAVEVILSGRCQSLMPCRSRTRVFLDFGQRIDLKLNDKHRPIHSIGTEVKARDSFVEFGQLNRYASPLSPAPEWPAFRHHAAPLPGDCRPVGWHARVRELCRGPS